MHESANITELKSQIDSLRDYLWSSGLPNPADHVEQISYLLFLKMLEDRDNQRAKVAQKMGKPYKSVFAGSNDRYRWSKLISKSGKELLSFVRDELFPFMSRVNGEGLDASEYFRDAILKITKPEVLHDLIQKIDRDFPLERLDDDLKGDLYEYLLSTMDVAGELGQFRTPRHLIQFIVELANPQLGETVCDPACGTGGFLMAAYENVLKNNSRPETLKERRLYWGDKLNDKQRDVLEKKTLFGFDVDQSMIRFARMNLVLHGLSEAQVHRRDAIAIEYGQEEDSQYSVVLTNPPFAGRIDQTRIKKDLPVSAAKTEILFLGHVLQLLKDGGRCGIIIPEGLLFGNTSAHREIRRYLLEKCSLDAVVSMPNGTFMPYSGVKTSVLIFTKGGSTKKVWFYELSQIGYSLDQKHVIIKDNDIPDLLEKFKSKKPSEKSWSASIEEIQKHDYNLSASHYKPRRIEKIDYPDPEEILEQALELEEELADGLRALQKEMK